MLVSQFRSITCLSCFGGISKVDILPEAHWVAVAVLQLMLAST